MWQQIKTWMVGLRLRQGFAGHSVVGPAQHQARTASLAMTIII
jgi:hypothetical protein